MLGFYENFPVNVHQVASIYSTTSRRKMQKSLVRILHKFNQRKFRLEDISYPSIPKCKVVFEFGIAKSNIFNYLDTHETSKVLKIAHTDPFRIMDFFCAIRYYTMRNGKENSLKFDYYMLRFTFYDETTEILIFHERGPRHISPNELINLIIYRIGQMFPNRIRIGFEA